MQTEEKNKNSEKGIIMKKLKNSSRGLTFSFAGNGKWAPGERYCYLADLTKKELIILPAADAGNTISRKKDGIRIKSLIDIRSRQIRDMAAGCSHILVTFHDDDIVVTFCTKEQAAENVVSIDLAAGRSVAVPESLLWAAGAEDRDFTSPLPELFPEVFQGNRGGRDRRSRGLTDAIRVISLFSGAGMLDYTFAKDDRFRIVYAAECDGDAAATYRANISGPIHQVDIRTLTGKTLPEADVIIGGPPCQPFSNANRHAGARYEAHGEGDMFCHYIRLVRECGVKVFAIENVPGLLTAKDGYYRKLLEEGLPGYRIDAKVVRDGDLGGYTTRKRAVVIGSRVGTPVLPEVVLRPLKTVADALRKVDASWPNAGDITDSSALVRKKISMIPEGGNWRDLPKELQTKSVHSNMYRRLDRNKLSCAIANWRKCCISPPRWDDSGAYDRILSVAEASALQGFGRDFRFMGTVNAMQQQAANGVTAAIGRFIKSAVYRCAVQYAW